ncbi:hypothetical protein FF1_023843 [Malus domestica]
MNSTVPPEVEKLANAWEDSDSDYGDIGNNDNPLEDKDDDEFTKRVTNKNVEKLCQVDNSKMDYEPFEKTSTLR